MTDRTREVYDLNPITARMDTTDYFKWLEETIVPMEDFNSLNLKRAYLTERLNFKFGEDFIDSMCSLGLSHIEQYFHDHGRRV